MHHSKRVDLITLKVFREKSIKYGDRQVTNPQQASQLVRDFIGNTDREYFVVMNLNTRNEPCSIEIVSIGSLNHTIVHPREIFKSAILTNADKIMLFHTHPCNSLEPSNSDIVTNQYLIKASKIIQIPILDHIIVAESGFFSFRNGGLMDEE